MIIAIAVALIRFANVKILKDICRFYVWVIRGTPLLVQLFFAYYGLSKIGVTWSSPFVCAIIVFALNEGAYGSETIRGSLLSVPEGQIEVAYFLYNSFKLFVLLLFFNSSYIALSCCSYLFGLKVFNKSVSFNSFGKY